MNKLTMDYTIRSSLARIIGHNIEISSFNRYNVISSLWRWISSPLDHLRARLTHRISKKTTSID